MIKKLRVVSKKRNEILILDLSKVVNKIYFKIPGKNIITFEDKTVTEGVCTRCNLKPCLQYSKEEIDVNILEGLPYNNYKRICPSNAIIQNEQGGVLIDPDLCINCGICFSRCPFGGIFYNSTYNSFDVNHNYNDYFKLADNQLDPLVNYTLENFKASEFKIVINKITIEYAYNFVSKFKYLKAGIIDLELILVRNLLLGIGIANKVSAIGNNDLRLDFIGIHTNNFVLGESELLGSDILGLPRRILEGISWLHSRKKIDVNTHIPCVVIMEFPRKRSDFYEVITDIENVTNIKIKTLSIYFLNIVNLFGIKLTNNDLMRYFSINKEFKDYGPYFKAFVKDIESIDENYGSELYTFSK